MKKELLIASVFAATIAGAGSVTTSNTMGYVPVDGANLTTVGGKKMYMVVAPFAGYDNGQIALADVIQTAGLTQGDEIFIPNGAGYDNWTLGADGWSSAKKATIDAQGNVVYGQSLSATEAKIDRGKAFWVKTAASTVSLFGNAVTTVAQVSAAGGETKNAWTMIGSTLNGEILMENLESFGRQGDVIVLANGTRYTKGATGWKNTTSRKPVVLTDDDKIPAGVGFWYASKSGLQNQNL